MVAIMTTARDGTCEHPARDGCDREDSMHAVQRLQPQVAVGRQLVALLTGRDKQEEVGGHEGH